MNNRCPATMWLLVKAGFISALFIQYHAILHTMKHSIIPIKPWCKTFCIEQELVQSCWIKRFTHCFISENLDISPSSARVLSGEWFPSDLYLVVVWGKNLFDPMMDLTFYRGNLVRLRTRCTLRTFIHKLHYTRLSDGIILWDGIVTIVLAPLAHLQRLCCHITMGCWWFQLPSMM